VSRVAGDVFVKIRETRRTRDNSFPLHGVGSGVTGGGAPGDIKPMQILSNPISPLNVRESPKFWRFRKWGTRNTMATSDFRPEVEIWPFCLCMRNASGDNYRNSLFIVDEAMGQIPRSTERISSSSTINSSGDEIANVNFLYDDIVHALKYNRLVHKFRHRSFSATQIYQIQWNNAM